jgi:hypothetical protein
LATHLDSVRGIRDRITAPVKIPFRFPFQTGELESKRFLLLIHRSPRSVKIAVERHDYNGLALFTAIHGCQSSRLPEDLTDDADDEDAVPSMVDPLAASAILGEIRVERTLFFHEGLELPEINGITKPEQEWSRFLRRRRMRHIGERVWEVRAVQLARVLMKI